MLKLIVLAATLACMVDGHGRLMQPPSRASQWRMGFDNPKDYNDNQGFCGGKDHQHLEMDGKCGICGDPYDGPWDHQAPGGIYANGNIVGEYTQDPEQDCFDNHVLQTDSGSDKFYVTEWRRGYWNTSVELPMDMVCEQCILQWTYTAGNDWGTCDNGTEALGCGPQETFRACADIKITSDLPVKFDHHDDNLNDQTDSHQLRFKKLI